MDIFWIDIKYLTLFGIFTLIGGLLINYVFNKIKKFNMEQLTGIITLIAVYSFVLIIYERLLPYFFKFLQYFFYGTDEKLFSSLKGEFLFLFSCLFGGFGYCFQKAIDKNLK
ncbi:MAG: hypothetical protein N4A38_03245 [Candidatus Gracilibacteria bacterium]|nr:hypothetical protein [Candidatus Gracilibacteria bacterium]